MQDSEFRGFLLFLFSMLLHRLLQFRLLGVFQVDQVSEVVFLIGHSWGIPLDQLAVLEGDKVVLQELPHRIQCTSLDAALRWILKLVQEVLSESLVEFPQSLPGFLNPVIHCLSTRSRKYSDIEMPKASLLLGSEAA